jgi:hypothetical protein
VFELKINREIEKLKKRDIERHAKITTDVQSRLIAMAKSSTEDLSDIRSQATYLEQMISKKVSPEDIKPLINAVKDVKYGFEKESEIVTDHVNKLEDKFSEFGRRFNVIESFTKNVKDTIGAGLESKSGQK